MASNKVTDSSLKTDVIKSEKPVLVDFWAEWCGPCVQLAPALEELSDEYKESLTVVTGNTDENPETPAKYGGRGIPTLILFKDGEIAATIVGAAPIRQLSEWISTSL